MHVQRAGPHLRLLTPVSKEAAAFAATSSLQVPARAVQCGPATFLKRLEIDLVWNSLTNELREVAWLASMVGVLSILSVGVGAGLALMFVGVT
jgi:hypothetical protein